MSAAYILLCGVGAFGALLDIVLHFLQLSDKVQVGRKVAAWITLASCALVGVTLLWDFNLGAALMEAFVALLAVYALVTGKEVP